MTQNGTTEEAYGADGALLERFTGDSNGRSFVPFAGGLLAEYYCGGVIFDHPDEIGSLTTATDCTGNTVNETLYYPYGEHWTGALMPNLGAHPMFAKLPDYDPETDQFNTLNRHYAPSGRWMSPDPLPWIHWQHGSRSEQQMFAAYVSNPQNFNMYAYVLNNPMSKTDPTGMNACGTKDDSTCKVTITITDRSKDAKGNYNDRFRNVVNQANYNATAVVNVNGKDVGTYLIKTTPSDSSTSGTLAAGVYSGTLSTHNGDLVIRIQPTRDLPTNGPNPRQGGAWFARGDLIHPAGRGNFTGGNVSWGCLVVCTSQYSDFENATGISATPPQQHFTVDLDTSDNQKLADPIPLGPPPG